MFRHPIAAVGAVTDEAFSRLLATLLFCGETGVHLVEGLTKGDHEEAQTMQLIAWRAAGTVVLATAERLGAVSSFQVSGLVTARTLAHKAAADADAYRGLAVTLIPV